MGVVLTASVVWLWSLNDLLAQPDAAPPAAATGESPDAKASPNPLETPPSAAAKPQPEHASNPVASQREATALEHRLEAVEAELRALKAVNQQPANVAVQTTFTSPCGE